MRLMILNATLIGLLCTTSALAQSEHMSALDRLSAFLNMKQTATISNVGQAFGLPAEDRPTKWVEGGVKRDLVWRTSLLRSPIRAVTFAERGEGSYLGVQVSDQECLNLREIASRFDAETQYVQQLVPDTGQTADTNLVQGLYIRVNGKDRFIDGMIFQSSGKIRGAGDVMGRCLSQFNIDGEPRVFLGEAPST